MTKNPFASLDLIGKDIVTTYNTKILVLKELKLYEGPLTRQYLPIGGIQTIFENNIVIHTSSGYLTPTSVSYDGKDKSNEEFIKENTDLLNKVLSC